MHPRPDTRKLPPPPPPPPNPTQEVAQMIRTQAQHIAAIANSFPLQLGEILTAANKNTQDRISYYMRQWRHLKGPQVSDFADVELEELEESKKKGILEIRMTVGSKLLKLKVSNVDEGLLRSMLPLLESASLSPYS